MTSQTILLTGSTGHVGYATLIEALKKGYNVRAAVRSQAKADFVKSAAPSKPYLSQLSFVVVEDITVSGAFDEAVKGVDGILHIASPIPGKTITDPEEQLLKPAIHGTTSILYSALKAKSIKRVIITSSAIATYQGEQSQVMRPTDVVPERHPPFPDILLGYAAAKTNANIRVRKFIEEEKPHFDVISIAPSYVVGRNELATTPEQIDEGSNAVVLGAVLGRKSEDPVFCCVVHIDDVAYVHVAALDPKIPGNTNYGVDYTDKDNFKWDDTKKYAEEFFPEEVKAGLLPNDGHIVDQPFLFDASETEKVFGIKFKTPAEMFKNIMSQYIEAKKRSS